MKVGIYLSEPATFTAMRHPFQHEPGLDIIPIEKIRLPLKSRDELPPILAGLQWVWMHPTLKAEILALLEAKILAGKQAPGRTGMDLWQILVLGVGCIQTHCRPARIGGSSSRLGSGRRIFSLGVTGRSGWCWKDGAWR